MRTLYLTRGLPGCGKSTFLNKCLQPYGDPAAYVISADDVRMQFGALDLSTDGNYKISQNHDNVAWKHIKQLLEYRMQRGLTTIVDATHYSLKLVKSYQSICNDYNYELVVIDFTGNPDYQEVKRRNAEREYFRRVPEQVLEKMKAVIDEEQDSFPSSIERITPKMFENQIKLYPLNYDRKYQKVVVFGDLHGCYQPIKQYFDQNPFNEATKYIFVGDYIDRGIQHEQLLEFLLSIRHLPNVLFLEGNHERWLRYYAYGKMENIKSEEFLQNTAKAVENIDKKLLKSFCKKLAPFCYFHFNGSNILVSHGGTPTIPTALTNEEDLIKGVGRYEASIQVDNAFVENNPGCITVHGHRNVDQVAIDQISRAYNLEGQIEHGGFLRIVEFTKDSNCPIRTIEIENTEYKHPDQKFLEDLVRSNLVSIKALDNQICSYNFTKTAFFNKTWNDLTTHARGLFIHQPTGAVVARSYDKFFNVGEMNFTKKENLGNFLQFPIKCYVKENGYLGIVSYDFTTNDFFVASKSTNKSEFAVHFKQMLDQRGLLTKEFLQYLKENQCSVVFEVIDPKFDPHIVKYDQAKFVMLDVFKNTLQAPDFSYSNQQMDIIEKNFSIERKTLHCEFSEQQFRRACKNGENLADDLYDWLLRFIEDPMNGAKIEGWVLVGANGNMVKKKSGYYKFWKAVRGKKLNIDKVDLSEFLPAFQKQIDFIKRLKDPTKYFVSGYQTVDIIKLIDDFNRWEKENENR